MEFLNSELVARASELPSPVLLLTAGVGPLFWVLGWRIHRSLFVAMSTVVAGAYGLAHGSSFGLHPGAAAALLGLSAAALSLALLRVGVFIAFGALGVWAAVQALEYRPEWQQFGWVRAAAFLGGGLISLACYRFLVILLTSFVGAYLVLLGGMGFAAHHGEADTVALAEKQPMVVSGALIALGVFGTIGQYWAERLRSRAEPKRASK